MGPIVFPTKRSHGPSAPWRANECFPVFEYSSLGCTGCSLCSCLWPSDMLTQAGRKVASRSWWYACPGVFPCFSSLGRSQWFPGVGHLVATESGNFFLFVVVCGGLNGILILGAPKVLRLLRGSARLRVTTAITIVVLVAGAQVIMPSVDRDALERSRPAEVLKDAVHVGSPIGW
jgi:hypothetical protein